MPEASSPSGHFARKQLFSRSRLIAWSHRSRFQTALNWVKSADSQLIGAELDPRVLRANRERIDPDKRIHFIHQKELDVPDYQGAFDWIVCMEVLEHVVETEEVLKAFDHWLAPQGRLLISVPVETGPALLTKQCLRRLAGWRGIGDYRFNARYTWTELTAALFAQDTPHLRRIVHRHDDGSPFHDHKGFNWRALRHRIAQHFEIQETRTSPLAALPPAFNSQVWFLATKRKHPAV